MTTSYQPKQNTKRAACVLVVNNQTNLVLAVSRKGKPTEFGLPGGKLDEGETFAEAAAREFGEETGYCIEVEDLISVFKRFTDVDGFTTETFLLPFKFFNPIKQETLDAQETGVVRWVSWETLFNGPFGGYNKELFLEVCDKLKEINDG